VNLPVSRALFDISPERIDAAFQSSRPYMEAIA
jgi:hypothetical protein